MSGNSLVRKGLIRRLMMVMAPPASPIRMRPSHKVMMPVRPIAISKPVTDTLKVESIIWLSTAVLLRKKIWYNAVKAALRKNPIQIVFSKSNSLLQLVAC